jgi:hypothetical protein
MVAKTTSKSIRIISFNLTFDERRFERLIIEFRKIVPAVNGRLVTDVILFSPSGHIEDKTGFLL